MLKTGFDIDPRGWQNKPVNRSRHTKICGGTNHVTRYGTTVPAAVEPLRYRNG